MSIQEWNKTLNMTWGGFLAAAGFFISCTFYVTLEVSKSAQHNIEIKKIQSDIANMEDKMNKRDDHVRTETELRLETINMRLDHLER